MHFWIGHCDNVSVRFTGRSVLMALAVRSFLGFIFDIHLNEKGE